MKNEIENMDFEGLYFTDIVSSDFQESDSRENARLRIKYLADVPTNEDILNRIQSHHPELVNRKIDRVYVDSEFGLVLVFFTKGD